MARPHCEVRVAPVVAEVSGGSASSRPWTLARIDLFAKRHGLTFTEAASRLAKIGAARRRSAKRAAATSPDDAVRRTWQWERDFG